MFFGHIARDDLTYRHLQCYDRYGINGIEQSSYDWAIG